MNSNEEKVTLEVPDDNNNILNIEGSVKSYNPPFFKISIQDNGSLKYFKTGQLFNVESKKYVLEEIQAYLDKNIIDLTLKVKNI